MKPLWEVYAENYELRQLELIMSCINYASNNPAGMPGHNLALIINKVFVDDALDILEAIDYKRAEKA